MITYFKEKNKKSKKKYKKYKMITTLLKSFDTFVITATTSLCDIFTRYVDEKKNESFS